MKLVDKRDEGPQEVELKPGETFAAEDITNDAKCCFLVTRKFNATLDQKSYVLVDLEDGLSFDFDSLDDAVNWLAEGHKNIEKVKTVVTMYDPR